jgi:hypothetical protein
LPAPRKTQAHVRDSLRPRRLSRNVGLHGIPGLDKAVGWNDPAFTFICQVAIEPGSYQLERLLHRRSAHLRAPFMREYFRRAPELDTHIAEVLERHGPPPGDLLVFG